MKNGIAVEVRITVADYCEIEPLRSALHHVMMIGRYTDMSFTIGTGRPPLQALRDALDMLETREESDV